MIVKFFFFNNSLDPLKTPFLRSLVDLDHLVDMLLLTSHQPCNRNILDLNGILEKRNLIASGGTNLITKSKSIHWKIIIGLKIWWRINWWISNLLNNSIAIIWSVNNLMGSINSNSIRIYQGILYWTNLISPWNIVFQSS